MAISKAFDDLLVAKGWQERSFEAHLVVDNQPRTTVTHKVDNYRNRIGVEFEWNNKCPFYDRDLNNFRLLHETGLISVGVILTRLTELQSIFNKLGKGSAYVPQQHIGKNSFRNSTQAEQVVVRFY